MTRSCIRAQKLEEEHAGGRGSGPASRSLLCALFPPLAASAQDSVFRLNRKDRLLLIALWLSPFGAMGQCFQNVILPDNYGGHYPAIQEIHTVYDAASHRSVLIEGGGVYIPAPEFHVYDGSQWSGPFLGTGDLPHARDHFAVCYDSVQGQTLLFGGTVTIPLGGIGSDIYQAVTNDLYALRGANNGDGATWVRLFAGGASGPPVSRDHADYERGQPAAFDPIRNRAIFVLPKGDDGQIFQTWEWTGTGWEQGPDFGPAYPDSIQQFVFDPYRNEGLLIEEDPDVVWRYKPGPTAAQSTWELLTPRPPQIYGPFYGRALVYDPFRHWVLQCFGRDRALITGGYFLSETRAWDPAANTWSVWPDRSFPTNWGRVAPVAVWDTDRDKMVVTMGYHDDTLAGPIYTYDTIEQTDLSGGIVSSSSGSFTNCVGGTAVFSVTAAGLNPTIQWYKNGVAIPGQTAPLLVLNNVTTNDAGNYVARVQNDCGYTPTPIARLIVREPIAIHRPSVWPDCTTTCIGSNVTIFPPDPRDLSLNIHLQKLVSGSWVDARVSTPSAPANFVFDDVQKDFTGDYRFYIDGSPCPGLIEQSQHIQVGFDISSQPQSLSNVRPCATVNFTVGTLGGCALTFQWSKNGVTLTNDGHFGGAQTSSLTISGAVFEDEGNYACLVVDAGQCSESVMSGAAHLQLAFPQWVLRTTNGPSARYANTMAYDTARGVTVMYSGGQVVLGIGYVGLGDLWEWNGARWRQRTIYNWSNAWHQVAGGFWQPIYGNTPVARLQHAMAYDNRRGRVVMFGGRSADPYGSDRFFNDTWEWDGANWQFRTTNGPPAQIDHRMAYDTVRGVTVLYGGFPAPVSQVWEWDGTNWNLVSPTNGPNTSYSQSVASMDYDAGARQILFGPATDGFTTRFFWGWDGHDWHDRGTGFSPIHPPPIYGAMVFDSYRNRSLYFGGQGYGQYGVSTAAYLSPGSAEFPAGWSEWADAAQTSLLNTGDFINVAGLAAKLSAQAEPVSQYLWSQLSDATRQTLTNGISTPAQQTTALAGDLNTLISATSIYDATRFASVRLSPESVAFRSVNPVSKDLVRFNRLLLEDAYPVELARSLSTPPGRLYHALAFDSGRRAAVLMGGRYNAGDVKLVGNETWELLYLDAPLINDQPASQYRPLGATAVFNVNARGPQGETLRYDWYFGAVPLNDGARVSGAHTSTLQIANVSVPDAGLYHVRVSDNCGLVDSGPAALTLEAKLQILSLVPEVFTLVWGAPNVVLEQAAALTGPWTALPNAVSPFEVPLEGSQQFFRLTAQVAGP